MRRFLLLIAIFVAQFAVFELGMRAVGGSEAAPAFQRLFMNEQPLGHRLRPSASTHFKTSEFATDISINAAGVRGPEIGPKTTHEKRIAILGDSLTLAVQVNDDRTFCRLLERALDGPADERRVRVINGGVQGYGPAEELLFYREVVKPLQPDLVLVMVFVANDAVEAVDSAWKLDPTRPAVDRAQEDASNLLRRTVRRSMVLQTAKLRVDEVRDWLRPTDAPTVSRALSTYLPNAPAEITQGLELTRKALETLRDEAAAEGTRAALVLVPARFQLNDTDFGHLSRTVAAAGERLLRDKATERFADALRPLGVPMLDLLPILKQQPEPAGLFFEENVHFTERGHKVVAEALSRFVREIPPFGKSNAAAAETVPNASNTTGSVSMSDAPSLVSNSRATADK